MHVDAASRILANMSLDMARLTPSTCLHVELCPRFSANNAACVAFCKFITFAIMNDGKITAVQTTAA